MNAKVKIIKIGGSVLTDKSRPFLLRVKVIRGIASEVAEYLSMSNDNLIIIHGGGSYGHYLVTRCINDKGLIDSECFSKVSFFMTKLSEYLVKSLLLKGVHAVVTPTRSICVLKDDDAVCDFTVIKGMISNNLIPVLSGDVILSGKGFKVLSGDALAWLLARELGADTIVFLTDVDGIYNEDPRRNPEAELIRTARIDDLLSKVSFGSVKGFDVTGGMSSKLRYALTYRVKGVKAVITNGLIRGNLISSLLGRGVRGTIIWT